jgi:hypothetical protein
MMITTKRINFRKVNNEPLGMNKEEFMLQNKISIAPRQVDDEFHIRMLNEIICKNNKLLVIMRNFNETKNVLGGFPSQLFEKIIG